MRGFEPLTPSMRTRCATGLRHIPRNGRKISTRAAPVRSAGSEVGDLPFLGWGRCRGGLLRADRGTAGGLGWGRGAAEAHAALGGLYDLVAAAGEQGDGGLVGWPATGW